MMLGPETNTIRTAAYLESGELVLTFQFSQPNSPTYVAAAKISSIVLERVNAESTKRYEMVDAITTTMRMEIEFVKLQTMPGIINRSVIIINRSALAMRWIKWP